VDANAVTTTLLAFLFVLGVLIFVHELGHFLAARFHGVRVITFSLGFGPKLLKFTRGDTEYCVSAVPLGGYVKMAGENPDDPRAGKPDEFLSKTKWQRFQILFAGPLMNIVTAVVITAVVLAQGGTIPVYQDEPAVIGVVAPDSPAAKVGIEPGDQIVRVDNDKIETWEDLDIAIGMRPDRDISVVVRRDGGERALTVHTAVQRYEIGEIGVGPNIHPMIAKTEPGPGERAGLKAGDIVTALDGIPVASKARLIEKISKSAGTEIALTVMRGDQELVIRATPEQEGNRGMLQVLITDASKPFSPTPLEAVGLSVERNIEMSGYIFRTLGGLFTGQTSVRQLQGPVGIAQLSGESAELGWTALLSLMAMLSINLGILNLMPVPVLDGGHILIMLLEGVARRDFSMKVKEKMLLAGFVVLMMLMVTVIYNDLTRVEWIERLMPWRN
jgi:regulator of sigma E protease